MQEFFRDVGFEIADHTTGALLIAGALALAGLILVYSGIQDHAAVGEYRVLAIIVGCVVAIGSFAALPILRSQAEDACVEWSRSADASDELAFVDKGCDRNF
jgi:hypothetical protein